jgi:hypothetical protein
MMSRAIRALTVSLILLVAATGRAQQVDLLAMGDWGAGGPRQREVAEGMGRYIQGGIRKPDAMLLAGDNFYVTLDGGIRDPKWKTMFEDMYDSKIFDFPFYVALGNHDYQVDRHMVEFAYAQANPQSRWKMPARWYRVDIPRENPIVTVIMLDSNYSIMGEYAWNNQMKWLRAELAKPRTAKWLVSVCHHPFFSNGDHGDIGPLQRMWGPLMEQAKLDFFIAGHDHDLQHLQVDGIQTTFLLVGGGGAGIRPMRNDQRGPFSKSSNGFGHLTFTEEKATVRLVGADGKPLHVFTRSPDGRIELTQPGTSDFATTRKVRDITRPDVTSQPVSQPVQR